MNDNHGISTKLERDGRMLTEEIERILSDSPNMLSSHSADFYTALCRYEPYARLDYSCAHLDPASEKLFSRIYLMNDTTNIEEDIEAAVKCFPLKEQKALLEEIPDSRKMLMVLVKTGPQNIGAYLQKLSHIVCEEWVEYGQKCISPEIDVSFYFMRKKIT